MATLSPTPPAAAIANFQKIHADAIKQISEIFESALANKFNGQTVTFSTDGLRTDALNAVVAKYREAGWIVKVNDTQRDGRSITLEVPAAKVHDGGW